MDRFVKKQLESLFICCKLTRRIMNFQNQPIHKLLSPSYEEHMILRYTLWLTGSLYFVINRFTMPFNVIRSQISDDKNDILHPQP